MQMTPTETVLRVFSDIDEDYRRVTLFSLAFDGDRARHSDTVIR